MSSGGAGPLVPTLHGFVHNTIDGLVLFEACLSGRLHHVPRRPYDQQRASLIKSGSIFIYEENASGIKRWTDGLAWSPSRILGNFLIYRELEKPFPPGAKKRAIGSKRTTAPGKPYPRCDSNESDGAVLITPPTPPPSNPAAREVKPGIRQLWLPSDGLVKKTMSVSVNGISHHMVSYYKVEDVKNNLLPRPLSDPRLQNISVRPELYLNQNFRAPVEETEHCAIDGHMHAHPQAVYLSMVGGYGVRPGQYVRQPYTSMYGLQASTGASVYGAITDTSWPMQQASVGSYGNPGSSAPIVKMESQRTGAPPSLYSAQYAPDYANMPRYDTQSNSTMPPAYHTAVQSSTPSFGSTSAHLGRSSYGDVMNSSPVTQSRHTCLTAQQQHAIRHSPPAQSYVMHSAPAGGVAQSPVQGMKSPFSAAHSSSVNDTQLLYRNTPYPVQTPQSVHVTFDLIGLDINGNTGYVTQPNVQATTITIQSRRAFRGSMLTPGSVQYAQWRGNTDAKQEDQSSRE
ncbi:Global transcription regulator sge1 [Elasticomyces elasticus]|nr:Global transcription regulator sge1 [Elasticomyces elasticus]